MFIIIYNYLVLAHHKYYTSWVINLDTAELSPLPDMPSVIPAQATCILILGSKSTGDQSREFPSGGRREALFVVIEPGKYE